MNKSPKRRLTTLEILEAVAHISVKLSFSACIGLGIILGLIFITWIITVEGIKNYANPWALAISVAFWASTLLLTLNIRLRTGRFPKSNSRIWIISLVMSGLTFGIYQAFPSSLFGNDNILKLFETLIPLLANFMLVCASFIPLLFSIGETFKTEKSEHSNCA